MAKNLKNGLIIELILLTVLSNPVLAIETNFPGLGEYSHSILHPKTESIIGDMIMQKIQGTDFVISDPIINEYLTQLAEKFSKQIHFTDFKLHFFSIHTPELNAFAFFGGHVAVHSGLISAVRNESELAAILAHETSHITQRHLARMIANNRMMKPLTAIELLAALAVGLANPGAGMQLASAALAGHQQHMINFTRTHEEEADRMGVELLSKTEFDPNALASSLNLLKQHAMYQDKVPEYLLTHPLFASRIGDAQNRAQAFPHRQVPDNLFFHLIRARLDVDKEENTRKKIMRLRAQLSSTQCKNKTIAEYAYALALLKNQKSEEAKSILAKLSRDNPDQWVIEVGLAEAELIGGESTLALHRMQQLQKLYPTNYAILLQYANLLLQTKQPEKLTRLLISHKTEHFNDPILHQLLARAYSMQNKRKEVHLSQAEWHFFRGEHEAAFKQLDLALEVTKDRRSQTPIRARKQAMKNIIMEQKSVKV